MNLLIFSKYLLKPGIKLLEKNFLQWLRIKGVSLRLCHAKTSFPNLNSSLLDTDQVQKYLKFIQADSSQLNKTNFLQCDGLECIVELLEKKNNLEKELKNLSELSYEGDKELEKLVKNERDSYLNEIENVKCEVLESLMPLDPEEYNTDVEIQIIPAIGGDEAKLFAEELFHMYLNYAGYKNWHCPVAELKGDKSELRIGCIMITGHEVHKYMRHEAGVHRVQRVPETERSGRTHTSTCSVAVLPQLKSDEINIKVKDIIIEKMHSSGPGGQNVNKLETCIRITHIPTGIAVENQTSRYQYENRKLAFERLKKILQNNEKVKIISERKETKKQQVGTNDYSDKIRTYQFIQNRVTDHRINYSMHNLIGFLSGGKDLDQMINKVNEFKKREILMNHIKKTLQSVEYKNYVKKQMSS